MDTTTMNTTEIYYPDGRVLVRQWETGTRPSYQWLRRAVGGLIESVGRFMPDGGYGGREQAWADEEGRLKDLPANIPGMKAINWPAPPGGWDEFDAEAPLPEPSPTIIVVNALSDEDIDRVLFEETPWCPVVGPVVVLRGWNEEEDEDEGDEGVTPDSLGEEIER